MPRLNYKSKKHGGVGNFPNSREGVKGSPPVSQRGNVPSKPEKKYTRSVHPKKVCEKRSIKKESVQRRKSRREEKRIIIV